MAEGWQGWDDYAPFYDWENAQTLARRDVAFWREAQESPEHVAEVLARKTPDIRDGRAPRGPGDAGEAGESRRPRPRRRSRRPPSAAASPDAPAAAESQE